MMVLDLLIDILMESGGGVFIHCDDNWTNYTYLLFWFVGVRHCWATSYGWCAKSQTVDLIAEGLKPSFIDTVRPYVIASEW